MRISIDNCALLGVLGFEKGIHYVIFLLKLDSQHSDGKRRGNINEFFLPRTALHSVSVDFFCSSLLTS